MAFTAQEVMDEAREQHPAFDRARTPESVLMRQLNRYTRKLYAMIVEKNDQLYVSEHTESMPLADFDAGFTLPADFMKYVGGHILDDCDLKHELNLIPYANRWAPGVHTPAYILGSTFHLAGYEGDWLRAVSVIIKYIPEPTLVTATSDNVNLPDGAKWAVAAHLGFWMARRQGAQYEGAEMPVSQFYESWKDAEREYLVEVAQHSRTEESYIREVW